MAKLTPVQYEDGTNSLTNFMQELVKKHKNEEEKYIAPLIKVIEDFEKFGPLINTISSKKFPPYKKLTDIDVDLSELRTYRCRYFIYKVDKSEWVGLHGYEKQGNEMPKRQKAKVKGEIKEWKRKNQTK